MSIKPPLLFMCIDWTHSKPIGKNKFGNYKTIMLKASFFAVDKNVDFMFYYSTKLSTEASLYYYINFILNTAILNFSASKHFNGTDERI